MKRTCIFTTAAIAVVLAFTGCKHEEATNPIMPAGQQPTTTAPVAQSPAHPMTNPHPMTTPTTQPSANPATSTTAANSATKPTTVVATKPTITMTPITTQTTSSKPAAIPGLIIKDEKIGTGAEAVAGKTITVNYTGKLASNGKVFDSSLNPGRTPFEFTLGAGQVIQGWDKGFAGMKVGGKRKLTISPELGYGNQSAPGGAIPANSTLIFDVELLGVK